MELCRQIRFVEKHGNVGGTLIMFQPGDRPDGLPFPVRKVLYMTDIRADNVRGGHAHHATEEVLVCLRGACTVDLDDGRGQTASVRLDRRDVGLYLPPHVWRVVREFEHGTDLLALASLEYDEADYVRARKEFDELAASSWAGRNGRPAGSHAISP